MPVYWFALSQVRHKNVWHALLIFIILHLLVYPASNGYNSYMDKDETSIGGLKNPLQPARQLFYVTIIFDLLALVLSSLISFYFLIGIAAYILASRAYSYRGIRLKKFAIPGYLTVVIFQGAVTFFLVYHGSQIDLSLKAPWPAMIASSLLIGGFYPLTQVYQFDADLRDGVKTISYLLGYRGTFVYTAILYSIALLVLMIYFSSQGELKEFFVLATCMIPILVYFFMWASKVWKNTKEANFENTMKMNLLASCCTNIGFIVVLLMNAA